MRRPFIFTSLGVVRGESKRGNRKCGPENFFRHLFRQMKFFCAKNIFSSHLATMATGSVNPAFTDGAQRFKSCLWYTSFTKGG